MDTPICDFVERYARENAMRLHMPGHKGRGLLGVEKLDITEIYGADSLYEADGIIRQSEKNAGGIFGADTFFSTEGSSLCIRSMLYLVALHAGQKGRNVRIWAGRNAHKAFLSACTLLDIEPQWLYGEEQESYLSCGINAVYVEKKLREADRKPAALYITSPDYLGNRVDIAAIAKACHRHGVLLLVDNAHGAYLKFLPESCHPIDLGADMCCDSAHKTLPALTGAAYLHISHSAPIAFAQQAKSALAMFGSTSPSYLILQSLDALNRYLSEGYAEKLASFIRKVQLCKERLRKQGYVFCGDEALKITISTKSYGYTGIAFGEILRDKGIVCEFADPDFIVLMLTPENGEEALERLESVLCAIPIGKPVAIAPPVFAMQERIMSPREAAFSPRETVTVSESEGRVLAAASVGCPPAVPIVICGEKIDSHAVKCFEYYGIENCTVVK